MFGRVERANHKKRYGFIRGDDRNRYYVSFSEVQTPSRFLDVGYHVDFKPGVNSYGRCAYKVKLM